MLHLQHSGGSSLYITSNTFFPPAEHLNTNTTSTREEENNSSKKFTPLNIAIGLAPSTLSSLQAVYYKTFVTWFQKCFSWPN